MPQIQLLDGNKINFEKSINAVRDLFKAAANIDKDLKK